MCFTVNTIAPALIGEASANNIGIRFMSFSSDLVFDGSKKSPYNENDTCNAIKYLWKQQS